MKDNRGAAVACACVCILVWGATFISTKVLLADMGPVSILLARTALGTVALFVLCRGRLPRTSAKTELLFASAGLTGVCLYFVLENLALVSTSASNVSVIVSVSPLLAGLISWKFLRGETPRWTFFLGFAAAMVGIWLVASGGDSPSRSGIGGDLLSFAAALCWAVYSVIVRTVGQLGYPVGLTTRRIFVYGLLFLVVIFLFSGETIPGSVLASAPIIWNLLFLGLGASAFCFFAWNYAVGVLGAVRTIIFVYAVPVITVVLAAVFLHERLTAAGIAGIALTLCGMILSESRPKKMRV